MMRKLLLATVSVLALQAHGAIAQEKAVPAVLAGHAILPAATMVTPPADAPAYLATSGKFTTPDRRRTEALGTVPGKDGFRPTGLGLPFQGQPVQGFSGIKTMPDGSFWSLSDNGFGSKANSSDAALMLHQLHFDWQAGRVERLQTVFLSDPDRKAPFPIVLEGAQKRYLTGADFDVESIQPVADGFWIGEEFGPYILKFNAIGELQQVVDTQAGGKPVRSPDHPVLTLPANPTLKLPAYNLKRSGGYEGLAMSKDGTRLYGLLEGWLFDADGKPEQADGRNALRILELDVATAAWTGRYWLYPLAPGGEAIGDFNMIDATTALVIERDNGAGSPAQACADPKSTAADCFATPAKLKRIYKIEIGDANVGKAARKIAYIDLMRISDPNKVARQGGGEGFYDMPFVTIENVDVVDPTHIIVGNDNNLPFSAGRALNKADDNEFVLLAVPELLQAR